MSYVIVIIGAVAFCAAVSLLVSMWRCRKSRGGHSQFTETALTLSKLQDRLDTESEDKRPTGRHHILSSGEPRILVGDAAGLFGGYPLYTARSAHPDHRG
jgi:hypothetical protein